MEIKSKAVNLQCSKSKIFGGNLYRQRRQKKKKEEGSHAIQSGSTIAEDGFSPLLSASLAWGPSSLLLCHSVTCVYVAVKILIILGIGKKDHGTLVTQ